MITIQPSRAARNCLAVVTLVGAGALMKTACAAPSAAKSSVPSVAPVSATAQASWSLIQKADARIEACRVTWNRAFFVKPKRNVDVEKRAARAAELARQKGASAEEILRREQNERKRALQDQKGRQLDSQLSIVRIGTTVRCELTDGQPKSGMIDFYDGKNVVQLFQRPAQGDKRDWEGVLLRDNKEILSHTLTGWLLPQFLTGLPLSQQFPASWTYFAPPASPLREAPAVITLEKTSELEPGLPTIHRLSVAREHLRPVAYTLLNSLCAETDPDRVIGRVAATEYRRYADGVWFPSKVTVETKVFKADYTLTKAEFNEAVDPLELRLPPNTRMADSRFGLGKRTVSYQLKNGVIPPDDEVRGLLGLPPEKAGQPTGEAPKIGQERNATSRFANLPFAPVLGLFLMAFGCVLWSRSRSQDGES